MFENVYFEISGICNGNCPYCVTGKKCIIGRNEEDIQARKFIEPEEFERAIVYMIRNCIIDPAISKVGLYNWGEPLLHPQFEEILAILTRHGVRYNLSTNCSVFRELPSELLTNLNNVLLSMPGFSQESYSRIHGFDFEQVKKNISNIVNSWRANGYRGGFTVTFHLYQFNMYEIFPAGRWARELGIVFAPNFASYNGHNLMKSYLSGAMDRETLKRSSSELVTYFLQDIKRPDNYTCRQWECLTINEYCEVLLCCSVERGLPTYSLGKVWDMTSDEIHTLKRTNAYCRTCAELNMDYIGHAIPKVQVG